MSNNRMIPRLRVLNDDQLLRIHNATMEVLEKTGIIIKHPEALKLLEDAGACVDGEKVKIPRSLIEWAVNAAPSTLTIYNQLGEPAIRLNDRNAHYGSGPTTPYTLDVETGEKRKVVEKDIANAARIVDKLDNIDYAMSMGLISDQPEGTEDIHEFKQLLLNTNKPICAWGYNRENYETIKKMAVAVKGSLTKLQQEPFYVLYSEPNTPLMQSKEAIEKLLFMAEHRLPMVHTSGGSAGGVAPVTLAGIMVVSSAEVLSALLIAQLKNKGTPCLFGYATHIMDMKTTICSYGCPEHALGQAATVDQAEYYGLPSWGYAGCSDAKVFDSQVAVESTMHDLLTGLSGANFAHDVGFIESGMTSSLASIVLNDEIISLVKVIKEGIDTSDEALAVDVIDEIGPQGNYLKHEHTLEHFKDVWYPDLIDRQNYNKWESTGAKSLEERAREKTRDIIKSYQPEPLPDKTKKKIQEIVKKDCEKIISNKE